MHSCSPPQQACALRALFVAQEISVGGKGHRNWPRNSEPSLFLDFQVPYSSIILLLYISIVHMRFGQVLCWLLAIPFKSENNEGTEKIITDSKHIVSFARLHVPQNSQLEQTNLFNKRFRLKEDRILYVDDSIIVVNKPAGIQTAPGFNSNYSLATIVHEKVCRVWEFSTGLCSSPTSIISFHILYFSFDFRTIFREHDDLN